MNLTFHMKTLLFVSLLFAHSYGSAAEKIKLGTYSLATESDWGASFELKDKGKLSVIPWFSSGEGGKPEQKKAISGAWKEVGGRVELTFSNFKDQLKLDTNCGVFKEYYCFRYEKSLSESKEKSPLNEDYPFINWEWKNKSPRTVTPKCIEQCKEMEKSGELKKGTSIEACAKELCN